VHLQHYAHVIEALEGRAHHDGLDALIALRTGRARDAPGQSGALELMFP